MSVAAGCGGLPLFDLFGKQETPILKLTIASAHTILSLHSWIEVNAAQRNPWVLYSTQNEFLRRRFFASICFCIENIAYSSYCRMEGLMNGMSMWADVTASLIGNIILCYFCIPSKFFLLSLSHQCYFDRWRKGERDADRARENERSPWNDRIDAKTQAKQVQKAKDRSAFSVRQCTRNIIKPDN